MKGYTNAGGQQEIMLGTQLEKLERLPLHTKIVVVIFALVMPGLYMASQPPCAPQRDPVLNVRPKSRPCMHTTQRNTAYPSHRLGLAGSPQQAPSPKASLLLALPRKQPSAVRVMLHSLTLPGHLNSWRHEHCMCDRIRARLGQYSTYGDSVLAARAGAEMKSLEAANPDLAAFAKRPRKPRNSSIPRIIHQSYKTRDLPLMFQT